MFSLSTKKPAYSKLEDENYGEGSSCECHKTTTQRDRKAFSLIIALATIVLCSVSFVSGYGVAMLRAQNASIENIILSVPEPGFIKGQIAANPEMAAAPPADGSHEAAWDELIPNGLGFIRHPSLAPEPSVVAIFHQLHCLYTIRRAYYAAHASAMGIDFNLTGVRSVDHVAHCFDYLQQSLVCAADTGIEPYRVANLHHLDYNRKCRDFGQLKSWAEKWRYFDGRGFLFDVFRKLSLDEIVYHEPGT